MKPSGLGIKASIADAFSARPLQDKKTMYRVCWAAHKNYQRKSYHFFTVSYISGMIFKDEMFLCPKCGRDSRPAPKWTRTKVKDGILLGKHLLRKDSSLQKWKDTKVPDPTRINTL